MPENTTIREETSTRELTLDELDAQLAEQLPPRELMGSYCHPCGCGGLTVRAEVAICLF